MHRHTHSFVVVHFFRDPSKVPFGYHSKTFETKEGLSFAFRGLWLWGLSAFESGLFSSEGIPLKFLRNG